MQYYTRPDVYADKALKNKSAKIQLQVERAQWALFFSLLIIKEWIAKAVNQKDSFKGAA